MHFTGKLLLRPNRTESVCCFHLLQWGLCKENFLCLHKRVEDFQVNCVPLMTSVALTQPCFSSKIPSIRKILVSNNPWIREAIEIPVPYSIKFSLN